VNTGSAINSSPHQLSRREFFVAGITVLGLPALEVTAKSFGQNRQLLKPMHEQIVCRWSPRHPRHDHQLIFPLDDERLLLVWSEYYSTQENQQQQIGKSGVGDSVSCQISSMMSRDGGRTWMDRRVMQPNKWKHNVKHPNLVRLSDSQILFSYVGWDSESQRNVFMRRSTDNGETWGEQVQISEPGWYCNNADRAMRLSTGRVLLPAHGPFAKTYIGGQPYQGGKTKLHAFVFYSDDGFRTWKRSSDSMTAPGRGCHEPTIVELKDGRLFCLMRNTNQVQYFSISEDGGDHWTKPGPTVLTSPESPALVKRIPATGDILVLWNNVASKSNWPRTPLCSAISTDEGKTWQHVNDIDNRKDRDAAYPSVTFVGDEALVAYYSRSTKWKRDAEVTLRIFKTKQFYA
jgi:sialidase-1